MHCDGVYIRVIKRKAKSKKLQAMWCNMLLNRTQTINQDNKRHTWKGRQWSACDGGESKELLCRRKQETRGFCERMSTLLVKCWQLFCKFWNACHTNRSRLDASCTVCSSQYLCRGLVLGQHSMVCKYNSTYHSSVVLPYPTVHMRPTWQTSRRAI
jgi:hypothetical protein